MGLAAYDCGVKKIEIHMKAIWNDTVIAESNDTVVVEGNHYFPAESLKLQFFSESLKTTVCPWKGTAHYYSIKVDEEESLDVAWCYPQPKQAANDIAGRYAFWRGVKIVESEPVRLETI